VASLGRLALPPSAVRIRDILLAEVLRFRENREGRKALTQPHSRGPEEWARATERAVVMTDDKGGYRIDGAGTPARGRVIADLANP